MSDEIEVQDEDTTEEEVTETSDDKWTPPSKEEWEKVLKAKDRYKSESQKRRERLEELGQKGGSNSGNGDDKNVSEEAVTRARLEGENGAAAKYRAIIGKQAAKAAFLEAGLKGKPDGLLKLVDFDELDFDDDGEVTGLEEQVRQLKSDYPELFTKARGNSATRDRDGSDKKPPPGQPKTATEMALARAMAGRNNR